jgi:Spy/CpxP family protein refolding chaperone
MTNKKPLYLVLFISLMANMFMGGFVISNTMMRPHHRPPPPPMGRGMIAQFEQAKLALSSEGKVIVDGVLNKQSSNMKENMHSMMMSMDEAQSILTSSNFDAKALEKVHQKMETNNSAIKKELADTIHDIATTLSPEDRIEFFGRALPPHSSKRPPKHPPRH